MLIILTAILAGVSVFGILGGAVLLLTGSEARVRSRVQQYVTAAAPAAPTVVRQVEHSRRVELFQQLDARWNRRNQAHQLLKDLDQGNLQLTITEFGLIRLGSAFLLALVLALLSGALWWLTVVPGFLLGWMIPRSYVRARARRRMRALDRQLPDILNVLAGSVRSGSSLLQALDRIAREADQPSRTEYLRLVRSMSLGATVEHALADFATRFPTEDIEMLSVAITIQQQTGGNLAHILDLIAATVRERHRILREIEVLSAQQRLSAYLLAFLPVGVAVLLFLINPHYIGRIFEPGWILILPISVVILLIIGFITMNRIAKIDV